MPCPQARTREKRYDSASADATLTDTGSSALNNLSLDVVGGRCCRVRARSDAPGASTEPRVEAVPNPSEARDKRVEDLSVTLLRAPVRIKPPHTVSCYFLLTASTESSDQHCPAMPVHASDPDKGRNNLTRGSERSALDNKLAARIRLGDANALGELAEYYFNQLADFAASTTGNRESASDLVQDVLLAIWERRASFTPHTSVKAYLYRAVRNRSINSVVRQRAQAVPVEPDTPGLADTEEQLRFSELINAYRKAIAALPERRRIVFSLIRLHELSYAEAAAVLDVSENTIRTQMSEALTAIREALADFL